MSSCCTHSTDTRGRAIVKSAKIQVSSLSRGCGGGHTSHQSIIPSRRLWDHLHFIVGNEGGRCSAAHSAVLTQSSCVSGWRVPDKSWSSCLTPVSSVHYTTQCSVWQLTASHLIYSLTPAHPLAPALHMLHSTLQCGDVRLFRGLTGAPHNLAGHV